MQSLVCESTIALTEVLNHVIGKTILKQALVNVSIDVLSSDDLTKISDKCQIFTANHLSLLV